MNLPGQLPESNSCSAFFPVKGMNKYMRKEAYAVIVKSGRIPKKRNAGSSAYSSAKTFPAKGRNDSIRDAFFPVSVNIGKIRMLCFKMPASALHSTAEEN